VLYYDFSSVNPLIDLISGIQLYNNSGAKIVSKAYTDIQFTSASSFKKATIGTVSIGMKIDSLFPLQVSLNINNITFECDLSTKINSDYYLSNLVNCPVNLNTPGVFPIYISTDNKKSYYQLRDFTVYGYTDTSAQAMEVVQKPIIENVVVDNPYTLILIFSGLGVSTAVVLSIILLMKYTQSKMITERLIKLDLLYLTLRYKKIAEIREDTRDSYLGLGSTFYIRSTIIGGLVTVFLVIFSVFISAAYINDTYKNNEVTTTYLSHSDGNIIKSGYINTKVTFNNLLYGTCEDTCANWIINSNNLQSDVLSSCKSVKVSDIAVNCEISWGCRNCQTKVGSDSVISFSTSQPNIAFKSINYEISINSFAEDNILKGVMVPPINTLLTGSESIVSVISNPTILINNNVKKSGYTLDYQEATLGSFTDVSNFNNNIAIPLTPTFTNNAYDMSSIPKNTIGFNIKISRGLNFLFINKSQKTSLFLIFFQLISILISLFGLTTIVLNIITKKRILKCILNFGKCGIKGKIKDGVKGSAKNNVNSGVNGGVNVHKNTEVVDEFDVSVNV
jgi:hypothetical protein